MMSRVKHDRSGAAFRKMKSLCLLALIGAVLYSACRLCCGCAHRSTAPVLEDLSGENMQAEDLQADDAQAGNNPGQARQPEEADTEQRPSGEPQTNELQEGILPAEDPDTENPQTGNPHTENTSAEMMTVHVCGAVRQEGVYTLPAGSRIRDAVEAAGGFDETADTAYVNLAAELQDAWQIRIPTEEEAAALRGGADPTAVYGAGSAAAGAVPSGVYGAGSAAAGTGTGAEQAAPATPGKVNLNTASKEELMQIPGIGEKKAQSILDYRQQSGGFEKIEDLMKVPGIKDASFQKLKDYIST